MQITLKRKVIGLATLAAVLPVLVMFLLITTQKNNLKNEVVADMNDIAHREAGELARLVGQMCQMTQDRIEQSLREQLAVAHAELARLGPVSLAEAQVSWKTASTHGQSPAEVVLPKLLAGTNWLGQNADFNTPTLVVDAVTQITHSGCTIFQRVNAEGDMIAVATSVPNAEKNRFIGAYEPRESTSSTNRLLVDAVLKGGTFMGRVRLGGSWHARIYEPIWEGTNKTQVAGMLSVDLNLKGIEDNLRESITSMVVGKTGYLYVLAGHGPQRGHYILSKDGARDDENIWDYQDYSNGRLFIQALVTNAINSKKGSLVTESYAWQNQGEHRARQKIAVATYFEPWDWVIAASMYEDDNHAALGRLSSAIVHLLSVGGIGGGLVVVMAVVLALILSTAIAQPINRIIQVAQIIAGGNLGEAKRAIAAMAQQRKLELEVEASNGANRTKNGAYDEPGQLLAAVSSMTHNLSTLVSQVQKSSVQLVSTATQIAATSRQQETTVTGLGTSTTEVAAAVKEISATSQELSKTMEGVQEVATETGQLADTGRTSLTGMESSMRQLADATASISAKLAVINEKATNISSMVTTIAKVADQTNLLSLNAAIEAEKAGEYGLGFAVVAREIRRLADQTAAASLDIEQTVKEMQSSVSAGVMEMDKFTGEVTRGVQSVADISSQLGEIIEQVKVLAPRFEIVSDGMRAQTAGAQQINEAMIQLSEAARKTTESLRQFNEATEQLKEAARGQQAAVARFKL
jgi:methyl-accepting chemotaxis protein WspA